MTKTATTLAATAVTAEGVSGGATRTATTAVDLSVTAAEMMIASAIAESRATAAATAATIASAPNKEFVSTWTTIPKYASNEERNDREDPWKGEPLSETTEEETVPLPLGPSCPLSSEFIAAI